MSALDAFIAQIGEATKLLADLQTCIEDHLGASPENINWGHVGNAGRLVEMLRSAKEAANA